MPPSASSSGPPSGERLRRMNDRERLECPLLRCTLRFPDHESMLRHLVVCDCLPSCEYWCYDHMRIERFDDSRCKKCLGHISKRRKMLSRAKHFFTALGHNTKGKGLAGISFEPSPSFVSTSVSPGAASADQDGILDCSADRQVDSGYSTRHNSQRRPGEASDVSASTSSSSSPFSFYGPPPPDCTAINGNNHAELSTTSEIPAEIDSRELTAIPRQPALYEHIPEAQPVFVAHPSRFPILQRLPLPWLSHRRVRSTRRSSFSPNSRPQTGNHRNLPCLPCLPSPLSSTAPRGCPPRFRPF